MSLTTRPRLAVLGLDGLPYKLAQRLCSQGDFPNLSRVVLDPRCQAMNSELPELSPVNWTSFFTGADPGEHGVFGFTTMDPQTYTLRTTDFRDVAGPTIFDRLAEKKLISRSINLPHTYPARAVNGLLISGFSALNFDQAVYPPFLKAPLRAAGYRLEADTIRGGQDHDFLLSDVRAVLTGRQKALELFWPDLSWDLFIFVLTEWDRLSHFIFPAMIDPKHPLYPSCRHLLLEWDRVIGDFLDRFDRLPEPKRLLVLSDHGFTELKYEVDINAWLTKAGFLSLLHPAQSEWDASCIAPSSKAFALDPGRIYIHRQTRFSRGQVIDAQARDLKQNIRQGLLSLTIDGKPVMREVYFGEELYQGAQVHQAPDMVCLAHDGFDLKAKFNRTEIFGRFGRHGCHTHDDAVIYDSQGSKITRVQNVGQEIINYFTK